ncbi:MAG: hypothetical protein ACRDPG_01595 [Nocardioidaceae bacterium]
MKTVLPMVPGSGTGSLFHVRPSQCIANGATEAPSDAPTAHTLLLDTMATPAKLPLTVVDGELRTQRVAGRCRASGCAPVDVRESPTAQAVVDVLAIALKTGPAGRAGNVDTAHLRLDAR